MLPDLPIVLLLGQTMDEGARFLREFGVTVTVLSIMMAAFLWGVYKLREDANATRDRLTELADATRDRLTHLIDEQRNAFVSILRETQAEARAEAAAMRADFRAALADQSRASQDVLNRLEAHWQRAATEISRRLEELTEEIQTARGSKGGLPGKEKPT